MDRGSQPQGPDQHGSLLERVSPTTKLGPVDPVLVAATVVATTMPHTIEVGVGTGMVPPASPLVQGTVTRIGVSVSIHGAERLVIMPGKRISSITMVLAKPQAVVVTLRLQGKTIIVGACPTASPVFKEHQ